MYVYIYIYKILYTPLKSLKALKTLKTLKALKILKNLKAPAGQAFVLVGQSAQETTSYYHEQLLISTS